MWANGRVRVSRGATSAQAQDLRSAFEVAATADSIDVDCIIFSKDRPMQLDACLRSIGRHAPYRGTVTVIYETTSDRYRRGYAELAEYPGLRLQHQGTDFRGAVMDVLRDTSPLVVFHTDDDIFFRAPPRAPMLPEDCAAFSLRLGENTTYSYPYRKAQQLPQRHEVGDLMVWNWANATLDFAYPMSLDGHLFSTDRIVTLICKAGFNDPNELERELHFSRYRVPRFMASFRQSSVVAVPVNVVTSSIVNRSGGDPSLAPDALNDRFLRGARIDLERLDFRNVRGAHQEIELVFTAES